MSIIRTYLSGLSHRPDIGESLHQIDVIRDGTRRLYLMEKTDTAATLHSIPEPTWQTSRTIGNPKYNNVISGQSLSARDKQSGKH